MLRAISCAVVVLLHAFVAAEIHPGLDRSYEMAGLVIYQLCLWATPVFAVLSGLVVFHRNRDAVSAVPFWRRRGAVVLVPFLVWTAVYALVHPPAGDALRIGLGLLFGLAGQRHLYFVAMIIQFYALFPLLARCATRLPVRQLLLPSFLVSLAHLVFFTYVPAPAGAAALLWEFSDALFSGWLFYLVLGAALADDPDRLLGFVRRRPSVAVISLAIGASLLLLEYLVAPLDPRDHGSRRPIVLIYSTLALPGLWLAAQRLAAARFYLTARALAACSFAVYLVHPLALHLVRHTIPAPADLALRVLVYYLGAVGLTALLIALLRRLPYGERALGLSPALRRKPLPGVPSNHVIPAATGLTAETG